MWIKKLRNERKRKQFLRYKLAQLEDKTLIDRMLKG